MLGVRDLRLAFGAEPVLDGIGFQVRAGERVALVGRNGSGKSSLLRVLAGEVTPDDGEITFPPGLRVARLAQEVPHGLGGSTFDVVASGVPEVGALLAEYHTASLALDDGADLGRLERVQHALESAGAWHHERRVEMVISRLGLPAETPFRTLSGGLKRRVLLGRALVAEPDVLLLDEPTNHLDISAIEWLEELLLGPAHALVFVTHDRAFLRRLATRILELDRGRLTDWPGDYDRYCERKAAALDVEAGQNAQFDRKLAQEEAWIRQGIKARRTRNEGRVRALEQLREERRARRAVTGQAKLRAHTAERSGKIVIEAEDVSFGYGEQPVVQGFSSVLLRGDKVGILGPNGAGKTTLLELLLGRLTPQTGTVRHGTRLEIAYFDQHREQLDDHASVADNVADGSDKVTVDGQTRHVIGYLQDFLFTPEQTRGPVSALSGGERHRLMLARLFTRPFNVLAMDEPTNDLDVETLELLEALLVAFPGTLLLVSHDRAFLDNVVTSTWVMEGGGRVGEYAGGYQDWLSLRPTPVPEAPKPRPKAAPKTERPAVERKLGYREVEELAALPARIETLETEQAEIHQALADPETYRDGRAQEVPGLRDRLTALEAELETAYERWTALEARST